MRYLHLDFKGIIATEGKLVEWLDWFRTAGFDGLVCELDCRAQWQTWPEAGTKQFDHSSIRRLVAHACDLGFDIIPLIQVHGHLEWILKEPAYAHLREDDNLNELCPLHPESLPRMKAWMDEALSIMPMATKIHLGGDETINLGSCPTCRQALAGRGKKLGKMQLFSRHVGKLCQYASTHHHVRPMIWDDMFCHDSTSALANLKPFPADTILVHWKYQSPIGEHLDLMRASGLELWGASAIRCSWPCHFWHALPPLHDRLDNIAAWEQAGLTIIHTTWGRPNNLWNLYGPWAGVLPAFIAAGNPQHWNTHPWRRFVSAMDRAMERKNHRDLAECLDEASRLPVADAMERQATEWFQLGLRYEMLHLEAETSHLTMACLHTLRRHGADDPHRNQLYAGQKDALTKRIADWEKDLENFWEQYGLTDFEEYRDTRRAGFFGLAPNETPSATRDSVES